MEGQSAGRMEVPPILCPVVSALLSFLCPFGTLPAPHPLSVCGRGGRRMTSLSCKQLASFLKVCRSIPETTQCHPNSIYVKPSFKDPTNANATQFSSFLLPSPLTHATQPYRPAAFHTSCRSDQPLVHPPPHPPTQCLAQTRLFSKRGVIKAAPTRAGP